ncbi:MAG: hypothetical protein K2W82_16125 [Candidatus Obscuribacterales bacterium]|nr:hypothetical protein [Candidatus Obscuribacterales bacterium]
MLSMIFTAGFICLGVGLVAKFVCQRFAGEEHQITWSEYIIAGVVMLAIVIPFTTWAGYKLAYSNAVTYQEFWHGYETQAVWTKIRCTRDGPCIHEYDCDPYTVRVSYDCSYTDSNGKHHSKTCYRNETRYHSCPYTTEEWTFDINSTVGSFNIAYHNWPTDPDSYRWRAGKAVPVGRYQAGVPWFWQAARDRLDRNQPGPVTVEKSYDNFILASQNTILKKYSADIDRYKQQSLLPKLDPSISNFYFSNRVYFAGVAAPAGDWQTGARYFNAAFGGQLQGDLYLVVVDSSKVSDGDTYTWALSAYWQSPEFEKHAMSKNAMLVVLGTKDGQTVDWARATTGMPRGNEALLIDVRNKLPGAKLTAEAIFGPPSGALSGSTVAISHGQGALENAIWGANTFDRVHMKDYDYLAFEIEPTDGQKMGIYIVIFILGCVAWGICIYTDSSSFQRR